MTNSNQKKPDAGNIDLLFHEAIGGEFSAELPALTDVDADLMFDRTKKLMGAVIEFKELMMMYSCAMKEIQTKFEVLNTEFNTRYQRNPISSISTRLKKTASIAEKLARNQRAFSSHDIETYIHDVAGVRIICSYIDDIYTIADAFLNQDDITLVCRKDYIANPKPNGYRSLHLIVQAPVYFSTQKKELKVEVQIRTIAMDFWASLEHQLKYKQNVPDQQSIITQLKSCADVIAATDEKMLDIRRQIETMADTPTEDDILLEKLSKFDITLD